MKRVLFISSYVPGIAESFGIGDRSRVVGWPAIFHTMHGFLGAGWHVDWIVLSEMDRRVDSSDLVRVHFVRVPLLRPFLGLWRRRWLWRASGLAALFLNTAFACATATRVIHSEKPDLVYCFTESAALAGALLRAIYGVKVVDRILGSQSLCIPVWKGGNALAVFLRDPQYASQFLAPADLKVITNDGSSGDIVASMFHLIHRSRVLFSFNGVDAPTTLLGKSEAGGFLVGVCARLVPWKRVDTLIEAVGVLGRKGLSVRLVIIGYGVEEGRLRRLTVAIGAQEAVQFEGRLPHENALAHLAKCDVVCVAHEYCNLPNTLWETMAMGKCVIGVGDPSTEGVLCHGENAYLVKQEFTADDLSSAIEHLYYRPDEVQRLGENARMWANRNLLSWKERVRREIAFIEDHVLTAT